jgi:hypothetical protein
MELEEWARPILEGWLVSDPDEHDAVVLSRETLPEATACVSAGIVVQSAEHWHPGARQDRIWLYAAKEPLGSLGLLIFATMFSERDEDVTVELTDPKSDIKRIVIEKEALQTDTLDRDVRIQPMSFDYVW